jgi:hypothetical protein
MTNEEKQPYMEKALETRVKYQEDMSDYIRLNHDDIEDAKLQKRKLKRFQRLDSEGRLEEDAREVKSRLKGVSLRQMQAEHRKAYAHRPKAPVSSFFVFYQAEAKNIASRHKVSEGKKLSRIASDVWKGMSDAEKEPFKILSKEQQARYH